MEQTRDRTRVSLTYDGHPSEGVVEAVAWVRGVEPTTLTPLQEVVDVDALNALFDSEKAESPSVTFEYEDCEVRIHDDGTLIVSAPAQSLRGALEQATNVLVLTPSEVDDEACNEVFSATPSTQPPVLGVTFDPPGTDRLEAWDFEEPQPAEISLITVGDFTRSSTSSPSASTRPRERIQVTTVADASDLATLGTKINDQLSAWDASDEQPVVCFHSITALLEETDLNHAFRFVHILTRRFAAAGAISHFHMNPHAHDDETINTLRPLFDVVLELD